MGKIKKMMCCAAALLALCWPAWAISVVSPTDDFYVLDQAGVLSTATQAHIVYNNDDLYEACGAQIVFVTLNDTGSADIFDYALELFNQWGIGGKNNGLLVLLSIGAQDYYYLEGTALERNLPAGQLADLVNTYLEPDFAQGDYDAGCYKLFDALYEEVADIYGLSLSPQKYEDTRSYSSGSGSYQVRTETSPYGVSYTVHVEEDSGLIDFIVGAFIVCVIPVSYTHLDVYKRQKVLW